MIQKNFRKSILSAALILSGASFPGLASATIVQFQTSLGNFEVNLYDQDTPETVANFLAYLDAGTYSNTIVHRSVPGFVIQGGGFVLNAENKVERSDALWSPINEPVFSNVTGTIAMAKLSGDLDSATNQWFFNLTDNSQSLDSKAGGAFTVFGEVMGDGMQVVNAIAALPRMNIDGQAFSETPVRGYSEEAADDFAANPGNYLVLVEQIVVIDAAPDTAADLTPTPNTLVNQRKKKKGGAGDWLIWLGLAGIAGAGSILRRS